MEPRKPGCPPRLVGEGWRHIGKLRAAERNGANQDCHACQGLTEVRDLDFGGL